jgi:hypothetical protein
MEENYLDFETLNYRENYLEKLKDKESIEYKLMKRYFSLSPKEFFKLTSKTNNENGTISNM